MKMEKDYTYYNEKLTALAAAYATQFAKAEATYHAALQLEQTALDDKCTQLYAKPREELRVDLDAMHEIVSEFERIQSAYPTDTKTLTECLHHATPRDYKDTPCLEAFSQSAAAFNRAVKALSECDVKDDGMHLHNMAKCMVTAEAIYKDLNTLLDQGYPTDAIKAQYQDTFQQAQDALLKTEAESKRVDLLPEYSDCVTLKEELCALTRQLETGLLSCNRLEDSSFPEQILLGRLPYAVDEQTQQFWKEKMQLDMDALSAAGFSIPITADFSSVIVNATGAQIDSKEFEAMLVTLFLQFIVSFPTKYLHVCGMQGNLSGVVCSLVSELTSAVGESVTFGGPKATEAAIAGGIETVSQLMEERVRFYGRKYADIYDYNQRAPETKHPFVLLLIHNYPYAFEERAVRKKVENLIESGGRCGILTLLVNRTDAKIERFGESVLPLDTNNYGSAVLTYTGGNSFCFDDKTYRCNITEPGFSEAEFWQRLADSTRYVSKPIMLDTLLPLTYDSKPYYDELKIPVGRTGNDLQFFSLDVESTGKAAALIAGGTGSGKTTFLHTLILSGAAHYSPDELEFYLIDFKDGVEFSNYLKKETEASAYIPHVSFLSLKNRVEDAYDVLHKIATLKTERNRLFNLAGATDFKTYHMSRRVQSGELPKLKRTIVIIDEYQNMLEPSGTGSAVLASKCASRLLALLKEVRNAGISIVLSSQAICVGREAKDQIFNRVVFNGSENTINSAFETSRSAEMMNELQRERGLAYSSEDGGVHATLFKAAWAGKTNSAEHQATAKAICEKWAGVPVTPMIISGNEKELYIDMGNSDLATCNPTAVDYDKSAYNAVIGQSFLSEEPVSLDFTSAEFSNYVLIGDLPKLRNIEAAAALGFLLEIKLDGCKLTDTVSYCDINYTSEGRKHKSPLETMAPALDGAVQYLKTENEVADRIAALHALYYERLEALKKGQDIDLTPRLLIINAVHNIQEFVLDTDDTVDTGNTDTSGLSAFDLLLMDTEPHTASGSKSAADTISQLTLLYERGFEQHIFVVLSEKEPQRLRELIPRGIRYEKAVYCSKASLETADWSSSGETISIDTLADNCCVVLPNISKVRPYHFADCAAWFERYQTLLLGH